MAYYLISLISLLCIAIMLGLVAYLVVKFLRYNRAEKIEFIKNFKKGRCAIIYLVAIPLYFIADYCAGKSLGFCIFDSISKAVYLVVLKYDVSVALIGENAVFAAALYLCLTLVIVNAAMITISILHQGMWKNYRLFRFGKARKNKCIVIGNNEQSIMVYDSCSCPKLLIDSMGKDAAEKLYIKGVSYQSFPKGGHLEDWLKKRLKKEMKKLSEFNKINVIVNCEEEQDNLNWCGYFLNLIEEVGESVVDNIEIYVFGDREFEDIYSKYEEKACGCLHYVNEYQQIAIDFIDRFPLTEYMNETQIDYDTCLLKPQTEINVSMIGFGRTNQQIFLSMVANNQFLTKDGQGNVTEKKVKYHFFDKPNQSRHKNLNHNYFRYLYDFFDGENCGEEKLKVDADDYLPLPCFPSSQDYYYHDINDPEFYKDLFKTLKFGDGAVNYIIVSLGMDHASIDMANKIVARLKEYDQCNTHVFVRVRNDKVFKSSNIFLDADYCKPFGSEKQVVYDYAHIIREKFSEMAIMRNYIYDIEHDMKHAQITDEEARKSRLKWYVKRSPIERESNIYACLAMRGKLHLLGLDCIKKDGSDHDALSEDEFLERYAQGDMPDLVRDSKGQAVAVRYGLEFKRSKRGNLAMQEHSRWNTFMITKDFVPATKEDIVKEVDKDKKFTNGKNYELRHHGNLTTFEGLVEFRKMLATRDGFPEETYDVIKYDYQLLDGAWWLLNQNGYKIVKRKG